MSELPWSGAITGPNQDDQEMKPEGFQIFVRDRLGLTSDDPVDANMVTGELARQFMVERLGFRGDDLGDVTIVTNRFLPKMKVGKGRFKRAKVVIKHGPIAKTKLVIPLKHPVVRVRDELPQEFGKRWTEQHYGPVARYVGFNYDAACAYTQSGQYAPARPMGAPDRQTIFLNGRFFDFQDPDVQAAIQPFIVEKSSSTGQKGSKKSRDGSSSRQSTSSGGSDARLIRWLGRYAKTFKLATALQARGTAPILSERENGGLFIECPFEEGHGAPSPQRTFVVDGDGENGCFIHCSGAACNPNGNKRDRAEFFAQMLTDGWLEQADLENPDLGGGEVGSSRKLFLTVEAEEPLRQRDECSIHHRLDLAQRMARRHALLKVHVAEQRPRLLVRSAHVPPPIGRRNHVRCDLSAATWLVFQRPASAI